MRALAAPFFLLALALLAAAPPRSALEQRDRGLALLENEQPEAAEEAFRRVVELAPGDPLGSANLAIAALRQQQGEAAAEWIARALETAPERPDLLAIQAEILQWTGRPEGALGILRRAAAKAPDDPQIQYALYRLATTLPAESAAGAVGAAEEALERLAALRPENLVVLLARGQGAIQGGDRAVATAAFLRIGELLDHGPAAARDALAPVLAALEAGDLAAARVPALRLENVLKVTPMYQGGLRALSPGIQGMPVTRFRDEPPPADFGSPVPVRFRGTPLRPGAVAGRALAAADLDGDDRPDPAWVTAGKPQRLEVLPAAGATPVAYPAAGVSGLRVADLDNDGELDLLGFGDGGVLVWRGTGGELAEASAAFGLAGAAAAALAITDFDLEGDLDVVHAGPGAGPGAGPDAALGLARNALAGPLESLGTAPFPEVRVGEAHELVASDLDRDGDQDLLLAHAHGLLLLDNLGQGEFRDRTAEAGLGGVGPVPAVVSADLDDDGYPDLVIGGREVRLLKNRGGRFTAWVPPPGLAAGETRAIEAFDADNDGRLDLALAGPAGVTIAARRGRGFEPLPVVGAPPGAHALAAADLDGDGDLDLLVAGEEGLHRLENEGGNANHWLALRLQGLTQGNSKNNAFGYGAVVEVREGTAYQFREVAGPVTHFGLGSRPTAGFLRVVWTNGVPQNRLAVAADQRVVEAQVLKGSCPFLYAWDGEDVAFVTDLLWGAPIGMPLAPGVWAGADPSELVEVAGAAPRQGAYDLRITEELWEAAFFDQVRLWVVDHPAEVEAASSLRILPGEQVPEAILGTRELSPVAAAWDAAGREVTARVARRDEVYADGWEASRYQGVARPWAFTFDLGAAPAAPVRLHLDGWIFPADASLNLALAQRPDRLGRGPLMPRLEVEGPAGWQVLLPALGLPAGKTKTMVVDTPPLPAGARRLRIVSDRWLSWDRIAWSTRPDDGAPRVVARLAPAAAELRRRGFSALVRRAPNAPHAFDYARVTPVSPWLPLPGRYTRYGDVRELLAAPDDRSVILAAGDELALRFEARPLPPPPAGWQRIVFLESHGWDKDADRNTWQAAQLEPLPFRAMSGYPYGVGEAFPDTPLHREYRERWLTREVRAPEPGVAAAALAPAAVTGRAGPTGREPER